MSNPEDSEYVKAVVEYAAEFERALGRMIMTGAALEHSLKTGLWMLIGGDFKKVFAVVAHLSYAKLVDSISSVFHLVENDVARITTFSAWLKKAVEVGQSRNRFVHDVLAFKRNEQTPEAYSYRANVRQKGLQLHLTKRKISDVEELSAQMAEVATELDELLAVLIAAHKIEDNSQFLTRKA